MKRLLLLSLFTTSLLSAAPTPPRPPTYFQEMMSSLKVRTVIIPAQIAVVLGWVLAYDALTHRNTFTPDPMEFYDKVELFIETAEISIGVIILSELILSMNQKNSEKPSD